MGGPINRWSGRVKDEVPSSYRIGRAARLNRLLTQEMFACDLRLSSAFTMSR